MATVMKTSRDVRGVGFSMPRADAPDKVVGKTMYVDDLNPPGLLQARLLRSPHAHARIKKLDVSKARALKGVRAVLTASDIPTLHHGAKTRGHALMAIDRVVFFGQPVAAIAADELSIADEALDLIEVEYEVLPVSIDPIKAMAWDAPRVADEGTEADTSEALAHTGIAATASETAPAAPNVTQTAKLERGDLAAAFAQSDLIFEKTYHVPSVHQGYIETHGAMAHVDQTGQITVWASTQGSFNTRAEIADVLEISESLIKVIPMECGGGFGAKIRALTEPITVLLSKATGRPVKYMMTRREELEAGMPAPSVTIKLKTGVKKDGTPLALEAETVIEAGAYSGAMLTMSGVFLASVYQWPNFHVTAYEVLTHKPSIAAYRAPMAPQTAFVIDSHMDHIARQLGLDVAEYKLAFLQKGGDLMAHGRPWAINGAKECLAALMEHPLWKNRKEWQASGGKNGAPLRGTGVAVGGWVPGAQPSTATMRLDTNGTLTVLTGSVDIAGTNQGLAMMAATEFGVDISKVKIVTGDTDSSPWTGLSAGSKTTYSVGTAVIAAAKDARQKTLNLAASEMEASVEDLDIVDDSVVVQGVPGKSMTLSAIAKKSTAIGSALAPIIGLGAAGVDVQAPAFAAQLARIEVDPDTGLITLLDFVVAQDVGKLINPLGAVGQIQGGAVQSLGFALTEGLMYAEDGRLMNPSLLDYRKLTAADVPNIETIIIEVPAPQGPMGARGVGEPPIIPAPAAIANAVEDATGIRLTVLPLTPERVALAIEAHASSNGHA